MKKPAILLYGISLMIASGQPATAQVSTDANRSAYEHAMKCFVANGRAAGMRQRAGDVAGAARYDEAGRVAFDAAVRLGQRLGYSNRRVNQDFDAVQLRELPEMVRDPAYFRSAAATCRALGLMPAD